MKLQRDINFTLFIFFIRPKMKIHVNLMVHIKFYPWFKFYLPLCWLEYGCEIMSFKQRKTKFQPRVSSLSFQTTVAVVFNRHVINNFAWHLLQEIDTCGPVCWRKQFHNTRHNFLLILVCVQKFPNLQRKRIIKAGLEVVHIKCCRLKWISGETFSTNLQ